MPVVRIAVPIPVPQWIYRPLRKVREAFVRPTSRENIGSPRIPNLGGDRDIDGRGSSRKSQAARVKCWILERAAATLPCMPLYADTKF
jgi:hypothetical protein